MKKLLSVFMAVLMVTATMTTIASADEESELLAKIATQQSKMGVDLKGTYQTLDVKTWYSDWFDEDNTVIETSDEDSETEPNYYYIKSNENITVTNKNTTGDSYMFVYLYPYVKTGESVIKNHSTGKFDPETGTMGYEQVDMANEYYYNGYCYFLTTNDKANLRDGNTVASTNGLCWKESTGYSEELASQYGKTIGAGESVTFTLPDMGDAIYRLIVKICYPSTEGSYGNTYMRIEDVRVNDAEAVKDPVTVFSNQFYDVETSNYFYEPVKWAVGHGITSGTSDITFNPYSTCTQAQIITFLWRANGSPVVDATNPFSTVTESNYYYQAVVWAYANGIINDSFSPNSPCTRATAVTYMYNNASKPSQEHGNKFTDVAGLDCEDAVYWALAHNITTGTTESTFSPNTTCTRAQIVTFLYRNLNG